MLNSWKLEFSFYDKGRTLCSTPLEFFKGLINYI